MQRAISGRQEMQPAEHNVFRFHGNLLKGKGKVSTYAIYKAVKYS